MPPNKRAENWPGARTETLRCKIVGHPLHLTTMKIFPLIYYGPQLIWHSKKEKTSPLHLSPMNKVLFGEKTRSSTSKAADRQGYNMR